MISSIVVTKMFAEIVPTVFKTNSWRYSAVYGSALRVYYYKTLISLFVTTIVWIVKVNLLFLANEPGPRQNNLCEKCAANKSVHSQISSIYLAGGEPKLF